MAEAPNCGDAVSGGSHRGTPTTPRVEDQWPWHRPGRRAIITVATFVLCAGVGAPLREIPLGGTQLRGCSSSDRQNLIRSIPAEEAHAGVAPFP